MNSFAMIFGHCVWIPPSPKAALVALGLFFGIGIDGQPDIAANEAILASQYVAAGKTPIQAQKEVASLNACFGTYEIPPENRNRPKRPTSRLPGTRKSDWQIGSIPCRQDTIMGNLTLAAISGE